MRELGVAATTQRASATRRLAGHACVPVFAVLLLVTLGYGWPLVAQQGSIPGRPDFPDVTEYVWSVGWVQHALTSGGSLLRTDALFVPFGADLRLNTFGLLQGLMAYPLTGWLGVVGAYKTVLLATLFLDGAMTYALIQYQVRHRLAALIAAVWFLLGVPLLAQIGSGRSALGAVWLVSGALLALGTLLDRPHPRRGVLLGSLLIAALLSDFQILFFAALWMLVYSVYRIGRDGRALLTRTTLFSLGLAGLIVALPFLVVYFEAIVSAGAGIAKPTLDDMGEYAFSYWHYATPALLPIVYGSHEVWGATIAAMLLFRWQGAYRFWLVAALGFMLLALGPYLYPTRILLPFALFSVWPPLVHFRTPGRLLLPATIGLAVVAAFTLSFVLTRVRPSLRWTLAVLAIGARLLAAVIHQPIPLHTYPQYAIYQQLKHEAGDFTILEVPVGLRSGLERIGQGGEVVQYYQHVHGKRLINGSMARLPTALFAFYRAHPSLLFLSGEPATVGRSALDRDFAEVLRWSETRYILVHRSMLRAEQSAAIETFLDRQPLLERLGTEDDLLIYRTRAYSRFPPALRTKADTVICQSSTTRSEGKGVGSKSAVSCPP